MSNTYKASCTCGAVQLEVTGEPAVQAYCHCNSCRGWLGAPIHAAALWPTPSVRIVKGADNLTVFAGKAFPLVQPVNGTVVPTAAYRWLEGEVKRIQPALIVVDPKAHFFAGEIHRARGAWAEAEEAYRRAQRADPADRRAQERALEMLRARKAAR